VDILIGTHRLLSKDVELPGLGLLILDEEQRFGVKHKERIKKMRQNIDALTLTATPIPRTLQLSLSGLRGLSVIETPPKERMPVATVLVEREADILASALRRELAREGQAFWVHNRVQSLDISADYVRKLVPEARVALAHGQMPERQLEEAMHQFWHGEVDVLVCTAIVESGLDFPRANTLIVDQAHMFGLGQLYQLRGRVGRSDRQAFAYFVVPSVESLPEQSRKRLKIVMEMDYLGAGFQVAMEDLRLRGAGNILGEPSRERVEPELNIGFPAHIPESYVPEASERLRFYKGLSQAPDAETRDDLLAEIRDRFGPPPDELQTFIEVLRLKDVLAALQATRADLHTTKLTLAWPEKTEALNLEALVAWVGARKDRSRLLPPSSLELRLDQQAGLLDRLGRAREELATLARG